MTEPPLQLDPPDAIDRLRAHAAAMAARHERPHLVVGITGPVGAGKSHVARALSECVVATDDYLPDYETTPEPLRDLPEVSDLGRLARDLEALAAGRPTAVPTWSFHTHRRSGERVVHPRGLIVCEGLHALHATVRPALDLLVFVEAPAGARWARLEHRERTGERGWGVEYARHFFETVAEPTFERWAPHYWAAAHVVVRNGLYVPEGGGGAES